MTEPTYEGGCLCGQVRYRASGEPSDLCFCHCRSCRLAAGAPAVAWGTFARDRFAFSAGRPSLRRSSELVLRSFCPACGTPLTYKHRERPEEIDVTLATLDDPAALRPGWHIWVSHKLPWVALDDGLPQYAESKT